MLTLIVPGLIWTRQALADLTGDLPLPAFASLLGHGRLNRRPAQTTTAALAELTGLTAPLPSAALRRLALQEHPGADHWLCLDPVRLNIHERSLTVDDPRQLRLGMDDAQALAASLATAFSALGQLEVLAPDSWNLRLSASAPPFEDLPDAIGRSATPLPVGPAHAPWRHALNEAQMILHDHPVNRSRQAAGMPVLNFLWPWGGGCLPDVAKTRFDSLWAHDPVALGIARLLQIEGAVPPEHFPGTTIHNTLTVFDAMEHPARTGDAILWREQLERFEKNWLVPALASLRTGGLDALHLIACGELGSMEIQVRHRDLWKFWHKPRSLVELAPQ